MIYSERLINKHITVEFKKNYISKNNFNPKSSLELTREVDEGRGDCISILPEFCYPASSFYI